MTRSRAAGAACMASTNDIFVAGTIHPSDNRTGSAEIEVLTLVRILVRVFDIAIVAVVLVVLKLLN